MFTTTPSLILGNECQPIEGIQVSSQEFYSLLESVLKSKNLPDVSSSRVSLSEGGLLSHNREYLRISRKEYVFDVCAAPFGTQCFVSWWFGENASTTRKILSRIPMLGPKLAKIPKMQTYYQADASYMFSITIKQILSELIESIKLNKGIRGAVELKKGTVVEHN